MFPYPVQLPSRASWYGDGVDANIPIVPVPLSSTPALVRQRRRSNRFGHISPGKSTTPGLDGLHNDWLDITFTSTSTPTATPIARITTDISITRVTVPTISRAPTTTATTIVGILTLGQHRQSAAATRAPLAVRYDRLVEKVRQREMPDFWTRLVFLRLHSHLLPLTEVFESAVQSHVRDEPVLSHV